jgi:hypothetical protein
MRFKDYFTNDFETSEDNYLPWLKSRYYRCRNEVAMDAVKKLISDQKAILKSFDKERHEIIFETQKYSITATVISPSISETAIDFKIITFSLLPLGKGAKIIEELYRKLDNIIPYKGVGLFYGR